MAAARIVGAQAQQPSNPEQRHVKPLVLIPMADGSEELEIMTIYDTLTRSDVHVVTACVGQNKKNIITGMHGMKVRAQKAIEDCVYERYDAIVLPGGMSSAKLRDCDLLVRMLKLQKQEQRWYAASCSAPAVVLKPHGLLENPATGHPSKARYMGDEYIDQEVVVTNSCVTSQGPGTALKLGLKLVALLCGQDAAIRTANLLLFPIP